MGFVRTFFFSLFLVNQAMGFTVLIDPGHGGDDLGAVADLKKDKVFEKDLALELSKRILTKLQKKGIKGLLSRSVDRTVTLSERAQLADKIRADAFISVHLNSSPQKDPRGFETYYSDNHNDAAVKKVEEAENKELDGEALIVHQILTDLIIERTVSTSKGLAEKIHGEIHKSVGKEYKMVNRGVKPGLFYVLALAKRPAILLEVGFLSNQSELAKIRGSAFQDKYAEAVALGVENYLKSRSPDKKGPSLF
jgi:N-acetylmuramoyl-L-alanine amidase